MRTRRVLLGFVASLCLIVAGFGGTATAQDDTSPEVGGAIFNDPLGMPAEQRAITDYLTELVRGVPSGRSCEWRCMPSPTSTSLMNWSPHTNEVPMFA